MSWKKLHGTESDILKLIVDFLEARKVPYFRAHPVRLVTKNGKTFPVKIRESQKGAPDLFVFVLKFPCPETWMVETKSPNGKLSAFQERWRDLSARNGLRYLHINSIERANYLISMLEKEL